MAHAGHSKKKPAGGRIEGSGDVRRETKSRAKRRSLRLCGGRGEFSSSNSGVHIQGRNREVISSGRCSRWVRAVAVPLLISRPPPPTHPCLPPRVALLGR
jgi:hypothetical protein